MSEEEDEEDIDLEDYPISTRGLFIEKRVARINKLASLVTDKQWASPMGKVIEELIAFMCDLAYLELESERQIHEFATLEFKASQLLDFPEEVEEEKPKAPQDIYT